MGIIKQNTKKEQKMIEKRGQENVTEKGLNPLMYFTLKQQIVLRKYNNLKVWRIANAIDCYIHKASKARKGALKRVLGLNETMNRDGDYSTIEDGTSANISRNTEIGYFDLHRQDDFLLILLKARDRFMQNPEKYGYCIECNAMIPIERLEYVPHTTHCVSCKENPMLIRRT